MTAIVSFETFTATDGIPIYLQILRHIKSGICSGEIVNGDEMPSRRILSALIGVNPNTIQKAYRVLEEEGLILSHPGAKSYVMLTQEKLDEIRSEMIAADLHTSVASLKRMGLTKEEALARLSSLWDSV